MDGLQFYWEWFQTAFAIPYAIAQGVVLVLSLMVGLFVAWKYPEKWERKVKSWFWKVSLPVLLFIFTMGLVAAPLSIYNEQGDKLSHAEEAITQLESQLEEAQSQKYADIDQLLKNYQKDQHIRISDLVAVRDSTTIEDITFEDSHIYGPALIYLAGGVKMIDCNLGGESLEEILVVTTNEVVLGTVSFKNVTLISSTLHKIGFIGNQEEIDELRLSLRE